MSNVNSCAICGGPVSPESPCPCRPAYRVIEVGAGWLGPDPRDTEIATLRAERDSIVIRCNQKRIALDAAEAERDTARERIAALEDAIKEAPHAPYCVTVCGLGHWRLRPCDCWKAALRSPTPALDGETADE